GAAMAEIKGDEEPVEPAQVQKLLRQAHDRELIDLAKEDDGAYTVKLRDATPASEPSQVEPAAVTDADEALDPPMPESSAPPSMRPAYLPAVGIPSRSARFRRGSRGPRVAPPEIPKIGVVEMDPNFKPRIELLPPKPEPVVDNSAPTGAPVGALSSTTGSGLGGNSSIRGLKFGSISTTPILGISGGATRGPREPRRNRALREGMPTAGRYAGRIDGGAEDSGIGGSSASSASVTAG